MKEFFIENENIKNTRKHEKFIVEKFKTERMRNSPIVSMQNINNEEIQMN